MNARYLFSTLMCMLILSAWPAKAQLYIKNKVLTVKDGLSDNRITCFYQDPTGFMWIGTKNGLNRYDGRHIRIFKPDQVNGISNEIINDITGTADGKIWVATMNGLNMFDPAKDEWKTWYAGDITKGTLPNNLVWDLHLDAAGKLWIASDIRELSYIDTRNFSFNYFNWPGFAKSLPSTIVSKGYHSIKKISPDTDQGLWLGTNRGLARLDFANASFSFMPGGYHAELFDMFADSINKQVFITYQTGGLVVFDQKKNTAAKINPEPAPFPSKTFEPFSLSSSWMAHEAGLLEIQAKQNVFRLHRHIPTFSGSILPGSIKSVYTDRHGTRWVATPNGCIYVDSDNPILSFLPLLPINSREAVNRMTGLLYNRTGKEYFICSENPARVWIIPAGGGPINELANDSRGKPFSSCYAIREDSGGDIWLLTSDMPYRYDRRNQSFDPFPIPGIPKGALFRDIAKDMNGNLWFATFNAGLLFYNQASGRIDSLPRKLRHLKSSVTSLYARPNQSGLWIGTLGYDLHHYLPGTDSLELFYKKHNDSVTEVLNMVNHLSADQDGLIWVSTISGGVLKIDVDKGKYQKFDMKSGLRNNQALSTCGDERSNTWILSGNSISAINKQGQTFHWLNDLSAFGISAFDADLNAGHDIIYDPDRKRVLAAGGGGLLMFEPYSGNKIKEYPLVITKIEYNGKAYTLTPDQTALHRCKVQRNGSLSVEFAGLYFGQSADLRIEYMLEGYDKEWIRADDRLLAVYQKMPSGNYQFRLRAVNQDAETITSLGNLAVSVNPSVWESPLFIVLLIAMLIGISYAVIHNLRNRIREERVLKRFATSLFGQKSIDDIFWTTAEQCVALMKLEDCVLYQLDESRQVLLQKAAAGPKSPYTDRYIFNPIEILIGKGIVGTVAKTLKPELIRNTGKDSRYIIDDQSRLSEIAVPVIVEGKAFGVIDSEHPQKGFYTKADLHLLEKMAAICAERISKYLVEERIRARIARDLHDELGSTLTSINIMSKVAMSPAQGEGQVRQYLEKIKEHSSRIMESMGDMVWAINPSNDSLEKFIIRLKEYTAELLEPTGMTYSFDLHGNLSEIKLNLEERKDLYLVAKEAIHNAVKYSGAGHLDIRIRLADHQLSLEVEDNGKGFREEVVGSGNGLINMAERARDMQAELVIDTKPGRGTVIRLVKHIT